MGVHSGAPGTKDKPQLVPSMLGERIVGCVCKLIYTRNKLLHNRIKAELEWLMCITCMS